MRKGRCSLLGVVAIAAALAAASPGASADVLAQKQAQARLVTRQIQRFDTRLDGVVQQYDRAASRLDTVNRRMRVNQRQLRKAQRDLRAAQHDLAQILVNAYKSSGDSATSHILANGGFSDLLDHQDSSARIRETSSQLVHRIAQTEKEIATRRAALRHQQLLARRLVARTKKQRATIVKSLHKRRRMLDGISADIRQIIIRQQERADALNARAARRLTRGDASAITGVVGRGSALGERAARLALRYLGVPYVWGGASPKGFDCSGLIMYVYGKLGVPLPHFTGDQWKMGRHVSIRQLEPGDLVFFEHDLGHVAMYLGGGLIIEAPHTGAFVRVAHLSDRWFAWNYAGAVRVVPGAGQKAGRAQKPAH